MNLLLLALLISQTQGEPLKTNGLIARTVLIENERGQGTGVVFDTGVVLTCKHLVGIKTYVNGIPAEVIRIDSSSDLAFLKVPTSKVEALNLAEKYSQDEEIFYIGNPLNHKFVVARGRVVDIDGRDVYIDAHLSFGASGSPVYNKQGELVGIVRALEGGTGSGYPFGIVIPADVIGAFVR